jgi:hypothetical protein
MELTRSDLKVSRSGHRSVVAIVDDGQADGLAEDAQLWREFEASTAGRRMLTWSHGLRDLLGVVEEKTDQEIVEEEVAGELVATLDPEAWQAVCGLRLGVCGLLEAAEAGRASLSAWLAAIAPADSWELVDQVVAA